MKKRKKGKFGTCAIKSDMHKAYDRVEWVFLEAMLTKLGFHAQWIQMVMTCVRSVEYKVRFNSNETLPFFTNERFETGGIPSPHICFSYVLKDCQPLLLMRRRLVT